jgi:hypothetical protein
VMSLSQVAEKPLGLSHQAPEMRSLCACLSREGAMFPRIRIASGSARTLGAPMHSATLFTVYRR